MNIKRGIFAAVGICIALLIYAYYSGNKDFIEEETYINADDEIIDEEYTYRNNLKAVDLEDETGFYIYDMFKSGNEIYFSVNKGLWKMNTGLYGYDGEKLKPIVEHGKNGCFTADENYIYYAAYETKYDVIDAAAQASDIIRLDKTSGEETLLQSVENHIWQIYAGEKIIYSVLDCYIQGGGYLVSSYSVYSMEPDGSSVKKLADLSLIEMKTGEISNFMVGGGYVYYINPETGELWRSDFEGTVNEFITDDTILSSGDDFFGVYMLRDKIYYNLAVKDENGEFITYKTDNGYTVPYYGLYRADPDNQNRETLSEDVRDFRIVDDMLIYNNAIYDENGEIIADKDDLDVYGVFGRDENDIYFSDYVYSNSDSGSGEKHIYIYNIDSGETEDITHIFNNALDDLSSY
ncbi:MAG: DUF5050 domain-containing protein [Clostridiales bacterium]|nr:DUF5050 domain-containing protein [Clostridiales bacterium]